MSVIEELQSAVSLDRRDDRAVHRRHRPRHPRLGHRGRPGKVLTNAHNLRGDQVTVTFADGRRTVGPWPRMTATATSR